MDGEAGLAGLASRGTVATVEGIEASGLGLGEASPKT
jgi:hypothetical protein